MSSSTALSPFQPSSPVRKFATARAGYAANHQSLAVRTAPVPAVSDIQPRTVRLRGDGKVPRRALQQTHTEARFQRLHAAAEQGFRYTQRAPGGGKTLMFYHGGEKRHIIEIVLHVDASA